MNNYCIRFQIEEASQSDILLAYLTDFPFYSFVEGEEELQAYLSAEDWSEALESQLKALDVPFPVEFKAEFLPYKNWNAVWESNFQPIRVDDFCGIRAAFHPVFEQVQYEIVIDPEMAFGTGHHATTYMMIELMRDLEFSDKLVFDYGCGTGILAILAAQMGAKAVDAIDISILAFENTLKNIKVNSVNNVYTAHGTIEKIIREDYDIILANINKNVILETLDTLFDKVKLEGFVLLSGILQDDLSELKQATSRSGFQLVKHLERGDWIAMLLKKS